MSETRNREPAHVAFVGDGRVVVTAAPPAIEPLLRSLGGKPTADGWSVSYEGDEQLARRLVFLRNLGLPFSGAPHGWPPAEVFADLRERGLVSGSFLEITWARPGQHTSRER